MRRLLPLTLALGLCALAALQLSRPATGARLDEDSPLALAMEEIDVHVRTLRRSLRDPAQNEASLAAVVGLQLAVAKAKVETPPMAEKLAAEERAALVLAYRQSMIAFDRELLALEEQVLAGDLEKAMETYKSVREREDAGHERFTEDE